jgi:hypothetical protein
MNRPNLDRIGFAGSRRILLTAATVLLVSQAAQAGLSPPSMTSGTVTYSQYVTNPMAGTSTPQFVLQANIIPTMTVPTMLLTPGAGFPLLTAQGPNQTFPPGGPAPLPLDATATLGGIFGTARTVVTAQSAGSQGVQSTQGGIFWNSLTTLSDNIPAGQNIASVSFTSTKAVFANNGASITLNSPGSILSARGIVGGTGGSYVAAGLVDVFIVRNQGGDIVSSTVGTVVAAASADGNTVNLSGVGNGSSTGISYTNNRLSITGTNIAAPITVGNGQTIEVDAFLTLIADPMSTISIVDDLAPGFSGIIPDFGAYSGGPFAIVPEPSTIVMLGLGLASVGAWRVRARSRRPAGA